MRFLLFLPVLCFCLSCAREPAAPAVNGAGRPAEDQRQTMAVIKTGPEPFWFEFASGGPRLIPSPQYAALEPFVPWKLSRYAAAFLTDDSRLVAVINQEGFLVFEFGEEGQVSFNYHPGSGWGGYSVSSVFWFGSRPAVLLARDDIFSSLDLPPPSPELRLFDGLPGRELPAGELPAGELPAFAGLSPPGRWETVSVLWGGDGAWYCRKLRRDSSGGAELYVKSADLAVRGEISSAQAYLLAARPENTPEAPAFLAGLLEAAGVLAGKPCTWRTISPEFKASRVFQTGMEAELAELLSASAYYRKGTPASPGGRSLSEAALALLPDGRGVFRGESYSGNFALPPLPEDYVYTAVCLAGENTIIASWEEQKDWNVGAAGFVMLEIRF
ncbi:MAG: hypothetical protein LBI67_09915 [Treponema sp.]|jgi:hypothetical protein|nr:hypothetical protein [Treponema sp.]